jgi:hypothetical protein
MGSLRRKIKRKKQLERQKHNKKNLKKAMSAVAGMPTECTKCSKNFDDESNPDEWMIRVHENMISLCCPNCNIKDSETSANSSAV